VANGVSSCSASRACSVTCDLGYEACLGGCCLAPELALGEYETCLRKSDESVWCWGTLWSGIVQGALGEPPMSSVPVRATLLSFPVKMLAIQTYDGCALDNLGTAWCWSATGATSLTSVGLGRPTQLSEGSGFACALVDGAAECWGDDTFGTLGDGSAFMGGSVVYRGNPVGVVGFSSGTRQIVAGSDYACALRDNGTVACWGHLDPKGGPPDPTDEHAPVDVPNLTDATSIGAGNAFGCAVTSTGGLRCWGAIPAMAPTVAAVDIDGLGGAVRQLAVGWFDVCVLTDGGGVQCWGQNLSGEAGVGGPIREDVPVTHPTNVIGLSKGVRSISIGYAHACAILDDGRIMCWGSVTGDGTGMASSVPVEVVGL
jgi:alpha-tubulin suppressor-like RCC1 family protein